MSWQDVLTFAVVLWAAAYLGRSAWRVLTRGTACRTGCGGCPRGSTTGGPPGDGPGQVIPLDALTRPPARP